MNKFSVICLTIIAAVMFPLSAHAQPTSRWGCGAGCAIEWTELSARKDMADGWRKVLIRSQVLLWLPGESSWRKAKPHDWRGEVSSQFWLFAQCRKGLLGSGMSSDRSDAETTGVFRGDGTKKDTSVEGDVYGKWEFICR